MIDRQEKIDHVLQVLHELFPVAKEIRINMLDGDACAANESEAAAEVEDLKQLWERSNREEKK